MYFDQDLSKGRNSEDVVASFLTCRGWEVQNKSNDKNFQSIDVDFLVAKGEDIRFVEVKQENRVAATGNLLLETITNTKTKGEGWFSKTAADWIIFHNTTENILIAIETAALRCYIKDANTKARYKEWKSNEGYTTKTSEGFLLPLWHFKETYQVYEYQL